MNFNRSIRCDGADARAWREKMIHQTLLPNLAALLSAPCRVTCQKLASTVTPHELADALEQFTVANHFRLHTMLSAEQRAESFATLRRERQIALLKTLSEEDRRAAHAASLRRRDRQTAAWNERAAARVRESEIERESTLEFQKMGGTLSLHDVPMRQASMGLLYRKRVFWLVLLALGGVFASAALEHFQDTLARYLPLVFFLPLLIDTGGNAAAQSSTLVARALATGDVVVQDWLHVFYREFGVALLLGLTMAIVVSPLGIWHGDFQIVSIVASSMILIVLIGSLVGMGLPLVLSRLKINPAYASAPLVSSIMDVLGVMIYLSIAVFALSEVPAMT
jgi:Mg/Co/Ni transporter MgtE